MRTTKFIEYFISGTFYRIVSAGLHRPVMYIPHRQCELAVKVVCPDVVVKCTHSGPSPIYVIAQVVTVKQPVQYVLGLYRRSYLL